MLDTGAAGVGLGALNLNDAYMVLGTFGKLCIVSDEHNLYDPRFANFTYLWDDSYLVFISPDSGCGLSLDWFIREFMDTRKGQNIYQLLDEQVKDIPPGSNGVFFLPFLSGGRSPLWNIDAKALFFGLNKKTSKSEMYRSILEGFAFAVKYNLALYESIHSKIAEPIRVCGGCTMSGVWMQILADVLNRSIQVVDIPDVEAYGTACLAIKASSGILPNFYIQSLVYNPLKTSAHKYLELFPTYKKLHDLANKIYAKD